MINCRRLLCGVINTVPVSATECLHQHHRVHHRPAGAPGTKIYCYAGEEKCAVEVCVIIFKCFVLHGWLFASVSPFFADAELRFLTQLSINRKAWMYRQECVADIFVLVQNKRRSCLLKLCSAAPLVDKQFASIDFLFYEASSASLRRTVKPLSFCFKHICINSFVTFQLNIVTMTTDSHHNLNPRSSNSFFSNKLHRNYWSHR